jgi:hypothetical protein
VSIGVVAVARVIGASACRAASAPGIESAIARFAHREHEKRVQIHRRDLIAFVGMSERERAGTSASARV